MIIGLSLIMQIQIVMNTWREKRVQPGSHHHMKLITVHPMMVRYFTLRKARSYSELTSSSQIWKLYIHDMSIMLLIFYQIWVELWAFFMDSSTCLDLISTQKYSSQKWWMNYNPYKSVTKKISSHSYWVGWQKLKIISTKLIMISLIYSVILK